MKVCQNAVDGDPAPLHVEGGDPIQGLVVVVGMGGGGMGELRLMCHGDAVSWLYHGGCQGCYYC